MVRPARSCHRPRKSFAVSRQKELSELAHALTSDFMANPVFFSGQLHPVNGSLQGKIRFEKQMFHYMLEAGDIGNVATFCQCLPSF